MKRKPTAIIVLGLFAAANAFGEISYDYIDEIRIDGGPVEDYNPLFLEYEIDLPYFNVPEITATSENPNAHIVVEPPESLPGTAHLELRENSATINTYQIHFTATTEEIFKTDFENDELGAAPSEPAVEGDGIAVVESPEKEGKSVFIDQASSSEPSNLQIVFPEQSGTVVVEGRFLFPEQGPAYPVLTLGNEEAAETPGVNGVVLAIEAREGGFHYRTGEDGYATLFPAHRENAWEHVKVIADIEAGILNVYINGWRRLRDAEFPAETDGFDRVIFSASPDSGYFIDDILTYKVLD